MGCKLVRAFAAAGIPIVAGTDSPLPGIVPGFSMHDELEAMGKAGLSNRQVLEGATRLPAEWLGVVNDRGVVAVGKRADLLLLDADPLATLSNTRRIAAVIDGGRYLSRAVLDQRLRDLDARYTKMRNAERLVRNVPPPLPRRLTEKKDRWNSISPAAANRSSQWGCRAWPHFLTAAFWPDNGLNWPS